MPLTTAPAQLYRDVAVWEHERTSIFAKTWQFLGLETDLRRIGDYIAEVLAGYPLVVIRDENRELRGYHNVCRHRAGPLVAETKGRCDHEFVCRFHEWRYGFDGALKQATRFGPADGLDTAAYGLFPIRVETWRGFVFVNLDPDAAPLIELLRPVEERFSSRPDRSAILRDRHPVACNWKVYVENYLEGVHLEGMHATAEAAHQHHHEVFMQGEVALCGHPDVDDAAENLWAWIWPNLGLTAYRGVLLLEAIRPVGPDSTEVEHIFVHAPEDPSVDAAIIASERITDDHAWLCEKVQQNLDAGVYHQGVLSPTREGAVAWFQDRIMSGL
ncbi:MAG TPA: aromatic ring-hydroxylating dioxygenase subunit alpha [Caulobacteraceae bacterium]|jgi:choline monooxygenase|nr:aromatic ring-hydroxylating dioxygenase subunit alpha [Caulobacteraceae bacterium]